MTRPRELVLNLRDPLRFARWFLWEKLRIDRTNPAYEQAVSDAMLGLTYASRDYDVSRGSFTSFAILNMRRAVASTRTHERRKGRRAVTVDLSEVVDDTDGEDVLLSETLPTEDDGPDTALERLRQRHEVLRMLATLHSREEMILRRRFGIRTDNEQTLADIAQRLGRVRERIRQIELKALRRMRHPTRCRRLRPDLLELLLAEAERARDARTFSKCGQCGRVHA